MSQNIVKIGSFAATTAGRVTVSSATSGFGAFPPNNSIAGLGSNVWMEVTAISAGSALTTSGARFEWTSPGGNAVTLGAISAVLITSTTNSQMITFAAGFVDSTKRVAPPITHVTVTFQTAAATNGISCDLYVIPAV